MLPKSRYKLIASLQQKKYRTKNGLFVAEGLKVINELIRSRYKLSYICTTVVDDLDFNADEIFEITDAELRKISFLKTPNKALAVFEIPQEAKIDTKGLTLVLDDVRDPGNLGTIIRLCDWFGIKQLVCSDNTVDCYNPKVVQATMGSIARVDVIYTNLPQFLEAESRPIYASVMNGESIYKGDLPEDAILIMGNEANGISSEIQQKSTHLVTIPRFGKLQQTESLNVAMATSILLNEFRRP
ncbi:TrmH family RNA methyltransferase [Spongiivirga citrea]|uniref:RNA methyltransferase n=1 Tax=Spongiivirga citrea TaxID=1481457 RepID=A0A6M0CK52_9FLAO|nr:RNA methyltransferase [Spongiivirga citrea]NER18326.1 RNA methyltransferase [Spongiivirga citrea]